MLLKLWLRRLRLEEPGLLEAPQGLLSPSSDTGPEPRTIRGRRRSEASPASELEGAAGALAHSPQLEELAGEAGPWDFRLHKNTAGHHSHSAWPVRQASKQRGEKTCKGNLENKKKDKTTNYSSINQIRVSQKSNLYISFSFYFRKQSSLASTWVGLFVKEQRTLQITHPWHPLSGPFLSL